MNCKTLISWYLKNKRDLPWRNTQDPYLIWISEVILQQTRVNQGLSYYQEFTRRFPDLQSLADSSMDDVLKTWQGLGYYSRARNMHMAARHFINHMDGRFPTTYPELLKIPGIGPYTAAAVASIAFGKRVPVVDGNVIRVLSRYCGIHTNSGTARGKKEFTEKAGDLMGSCDPGNFNQSIMEFGAIQCIPRQPSCAICPFSDSCYALSHDAVASLPSRPLKPGRRKRYFYYFVIIHNGRIMVRKRTGKDIWQGLFDFPMIETSRTMSLNRLVLTAQWDALFGGPTTGQFQLKPIGKTYRHVLTHQEIYANFFMVSGETGIKPDGDSLSEIPAGQFRQLPVPRLIEIFIREMDWPN